LSVREAGATQKGDDMNGFDRREQPPASAYKLDAEGGVELTEGALETCVEEGALPEGHDGCFDVPTRFEVCGTCEGRGKHVDPAIDAGGLTPEDFDADPGFADAYFAGRYDIACVECDGLRVVPRATFPAPIAAALVKWAREEADYARHCAAERRYGC